MPEIQYTQLEIPVPGSKLPNQFLRPGQPGEYLGIIFPGLYYTVDQPLLYYPTHSLLNHHADVLQLHADYTAPEHRALPANERIKRVMEDAQALAQAGLAQKDYQKVVLVGKSIGTLAMAHLIHSDHKMENSLAVWLTPLFSQSYMVEAALKCKGAQFISAGTADDLYDPSILKRIQDARQAEAVIVDDADHSLEIPGDFARSLKTLEAVMLSLDAFLSRSLK